MKAEFVDRAKLRVDEFITYRLHLLAKLADRGAMLLYGAQFGLSLREWRVFSVIGCFAPLSMGEVGERSNLDRGHASRAVDALVKRKIVRRRRNKLDKRGWVLELRPEGQTLFDQVYPMAVERNMRLISCLSKTEYECMVGALQKMTAEIRSINAEFERAAHGDAPSQNDEQEND